MSNSATALTIVGNLVDDPEVRFTTKGVACANFSVAVNHKTFDATTKRWEDVRTDFHRVTVWRSLAENVAESLRKGDRVVVVGHLGSSQYEDREGNKRISWEITATSVGPDLMFASATPKKTEYHNAKKSGSKPDPWKDEETRNEPRETLENERKSSRARR